MNAYDAAEQAYKKGYEKGKQDAVKWIPASDPPKKHGKYLVICENIKEAQIRLYEGSWDSIQKVIKWMPLPLP